MDEIVSLVVANGIFAVLFCGLLVFELRDSRARESKYVKTINTLNERLKTVDSVKSDTAEIKTDVDGIKTDVATIKHAVVKKPVKKGGVECAVVAAV
ncbi:MAG: hypothetical protein K2L88_03860 [Clostridiales bacterium]|nr:hypothetical protein [Clostridiales bacterium]